MIVKCTVTQESIDKDCHKYTNCPVAEAIQSKLRTEHVTVVTESQILLYSKWKQ